MAASRPLTEAQEVSLSLDQTSCAHHQAPPAGDGIEEDMGQSHSKTRATPNKNSNRTKADCQ